uniref:Uncharacterized protein n=1 Tax=Pseudomonas aeruginosa TaxID=287 RepID=A0A7G8AAR2_PSEAI|nr:Hypothetical protein [Pseudomonas aeruginosa]
MSAQSIPARRRSTHLCGISHTVHRIPVAKTEHGFAVSHEKQGAHKNPVTVAIGSELERSPDSGLENERSLTHRSGNSGSFCGVPTTDHASRAGNSGRSPNSGRNIGPGLPLKALPRKSAERADVVFLGWIDAPRGEDQEGSPYTEFRSPSASLAGALPGAHQNPVLNGVASSGTLRS